MGYYYAALQSRSHAFLLERRMKDEGVECELSFMPRQIMTDLCSMGVRFEERELRGALRVLCRAGLPGCKLYRESTEPWGSAYTEVAF